MNLQSRERARAADKRYYEQHKEARCAKSRRWNKENPERHAANQRRHYAKTAEKQRQFQRDKLAFNRLCVLLHYGHVCSCCGETRREFLSVDHIEGDGAAHRRAVGSGAPMYRWIIDNNYPDNLRLLCHNCNLALGFYGYCPHGGLN